MYDELVKSLRDCAEINSLSLYKRGLMKQAADAIEELSEDNAALNGTVANLLERIADLGKTSRWISVEDRLPERNGTYLVYVYGDVTDLNYWRGKWHRLGDDYTKAVTHWMPLPEPPKAEEGE